MHLPSSPIAQDSKIELNLLHRSTTISVCRWVRPRPEFYDIDKTARVNSNFVVGQKIVPRGRSPRPSRPNFVHHPKATRQWSTDGIWDESSAEMKTEIWQAAFLLPCSFASLGHTWSIRQEITKLLLSTWDSGHLPYGTSIEFPTAKHSLSLKIQYSYSLPRQFSPSLRSVPSLVRT
jgi:hypothetical protein